MIELRGLDCESLAAREAGVAFNHTFGFIRKIPPWNRVPEVRSMRRCDSSGFDKTVCTCAAQRLAMVPVGGR